MKVVTNFLASTHLVAIGEASYGFTKKAGIDLGKAYDAIKISSGNSFVHETESQVILNGSRDINFTMDLVLKDIGLFQGVADRHNVPLEISPMLIKIFEDGQNRLVRVNGRQILLSVLKRHAALIFWHLDFRLS